MMFKAFLLLLFASSSAFADDVPSVIETAKRMKWDIAQVREFYQGGCESGRPTEMTICATHSFVAADMELNHVYAQLLSELKVKDAKYKLKAAQQSWVKFRDASCAFEADGYSRRSRDFQAVLMSCMAIRTDERIKQLKLFTGCGEAYGCPGAE